MLEKSGIALTVVIILTWGFLADSWADQGPVPKLERGLANVVTSPVEIPKQIRLFWIEGSAKTFHISAWIFCGLVKGMAMTVARIGSGLWDIVSFPVAIPADDQPLLKPDFVFEDWPQRQKGVLYKNLGDE